MVIFFFFASATHRIKFLSIFIALPEKPDTMKKIIFPMVFFSFLIQTVNFAQSTIIIQPGPEGKDAQLWSITPDLNIGNTPKFLASGWTHGGEPGINRALIDFDLSEIPENAVITSAKLNLYFLCLEPNFMGHTGQNSATLSLVTEPWDEATVTWNTQPATTPENQVYLPQSAAPYMDYTDIDITGLIQSLLTSPEEYHGIMMRLQNENPYRCILFASGDYSDTISMRPRLEITYTSESNTIVIQPGQEGKDALVWSAYPLYHFGNSPKFTCMAWSHYKEICTTRSMVEFDLSVIPANATITDARLSLYFVSQENLIEGHTGENESVLRLITEPWEEDDVTWANQPETTTDFQVNLPASTDPYQDFTNIDVTNLISKQFEQPGQYHGLLLRLADESIYKCLLFASGDYAESAELHPKLEVSYTVSTVTIEIQPGEEGKDAQINTILPGNNYGNSPIFKAAAWTHSGEPGTNRALVEYDLSVLPENAVIEDARLNLYFANKEPTFYGHTGENDAWLQLITEPWEEMEVTWNNQPATTSQYQVYIPQSVEEFQDYTNIDVTEVITRLYNEPETYHGLLFRLIHEEYYRCLLFASSDYTDTVENRPKLVITYSICQDPIAVYTFEKEDFSVYFHDQSLHGESLYWDFGDGYYSDLNEPWHIYDNPGTYEVCLTVWNECGVDSVCHMINIEQNAEPSDTYDNTISIYPNPAVHYFNVTSTIEEEVSVLLLSPNGEAVVKRIDNIDPDNGITIETSKLNPGIYFLKISGPSGHSIKKIMVNH